MSAFTRRGVTLFLCTLALIQSTPLAAQSLQRGPYLQQVTPDSIVVRWRGSDATDGVVRYGQSPDALDRSASSTGSDTDHVVTVTGLRPDTRYYYTVGHAGGALTTAGNSYHFDTAPMAGSSAAFRVWVIGDSGTADSNAAAVRDAYLDRAGMQPADLWLMLGDNAYENGTDSEYQDAVFDMYPEILRNTPLYPTLGNHDGRSADSDNGAGPYYDIFTLPRNAEAGGLPSGTEAYYAFDYGNVHFITLDSYETDRAADGAMLRWLENDLAATSQRWIVAFWHHPPYSKGSHDSDAADEDELIDMRERAVPILEAYGVDLVLSGHSHSYERSFLIDGHHGPSDTLNASMIIDGGNGRDDGDGAYSKTTAGNPHEGAVYTVAGSSGKTGGGSLDHPVMYTSLRTLGSLLLDISDDTLRAEFIDSNGDRRDYFAIRKYSGGTDRSPPTVPAGFAAGQVQQTSVSLSWDASTDNVAVAGYRLSRNDATIATVTTTVFADSGLKANTVYNYEVIAFDAAGNESQPASLTTTTNNTADTEPPAAVSNLHASAISSSSISLAWNAASDNVAVSGYEVARDGAVVASTGAPLFTDFGLDASTRYEYRVQALDDAGNVSTAATLTVSTGPAAPPSVDAGGGAAGGLLLLALMAAARRPAVITVLVMLSVPGLLQAHAAVDEQLADVDAQLAHATATVPVLLRRGRLQLRQGDAGAALASFRAARALGGKPHPAIVDHELARAQFDRGAYREALALSNRFLAAEPRSAEGYRLRARTHAAMGEAEAALADFGRAIANHPQPTPELYMARARVLEGRPGRHAELLRGLDEGLAALGPVSSLSSYAIDIAEQCGHYTEALQRVRTLPAVLRYTPRWLFRESRLLHLDGRLQAARRANRAALLVLEQHVARRGQTAALARLRRNLQTDYVAMSTTRQPSPWTWNRLRTAVSACRGSR